MRVSSEKRRKRRALLVSAAALALLAAVGYAALRPVEKPRSSAEQLALYTRRKSDAEVTVAVVRGGEMDIRVYGQNGEPLEDRGSSYEIGSVTKTFTGGAIAMAITQGKLDLDDPVSAYIDFDGTYDPTIRELVTHTSAYGARLGSGLAAAVRVAAGRNPYRGMDTDAIIAEMEAFRPGSPGPYEYSYSNFGVGVLGVVLERIYGRSFQSLMAGFIAGECGLAETVFGTDGILENAWIWNGDDTMAACGGLVSTAADMAAYARLWFGELADWQKLAVTPVLAVDDNTLIGILWGVQKTPALIGHSGQTSHYASQIMIDMENDVAVIVLSNYANDRYGDVGSIAEAVYRETMEAGTDP